MIAVCEENRLNMLKAKTVKECNEVREARKYHREFVRRERLSYANDCERARNSSTFRVITMDGADSNTLYCPQYYRQLIRMEVDKKATLKQVCFGNNADVQVKTITNYTSIRNSKRYSYMENRTHFFTICLHQRWVFRL